MASIDLKSTCSHGTTETSNSLIRHAKENDPQAWERVVKLYSPMVYFWCRESGLPDPDLHDVFQDVFHTLARNISKFQSIENGSFRGWLRTLTRNRIADHFRQTGRHPRAIGGTDAQLYLEQFPDEVVQDSFAMPANSSSGELEIQHLILRQALARIRDCFSEQTWKAFWMVVVDGRATSDVADELGMKCGTVRVAKSRVLKRLRSEIGDWDSQT